MKKKHLIVTSYSLNDDIGMIILMHGTSGIDFHICLSSSRSA